MAVPGSRPFRDWLQAQMELRGVVGVGEAGRVLGLPQSMMSRYLGGLDRPSRKNVIKIAHGLGIPVAEVQDAVDADAGRLSAPAPAAELAEIRRLLGALAAQLDAGPLPVAHLGGTGTPGGPPATRMLEAAGPLAGSAGGGWIPEIVRAPHPLAVAAGADRVVVWLLDTTAPQPGFWVRVGAARDPSDIKRWAEGDDVTGVVAIQQVVPRA